MVIMEDLEPYISNNYFLLLVIAASCLAVHLLMNQRLCSNCLSLVKNDSVKPSDDDEDLDTCCDDGDVDMIPYVNGPRKSETTTIRLSSDYYKLMKRRRSIRFFSSDPVPREVINNLILAAGTSPSGANQQPWTFVVVESARMKKRVRDIVENEEEINYRRRMSQTWLEDLKTYRTNSVKPYLEEAPYLIVVFKQVYGIVSSESGNEERRTHYYAELSTCIACGILITAIHHAGLVTLTSTPMNCGPALRELLGRPDNEKVLLLLPVGYPAPDAVVPNIRKKSLQQIMVTA